MRTVLAVAALVLAGCGTSVPVAVPAPTTSTTTTTTTTSTTTQPPTNDYGLTAEGIDALFLANVHELAPETFGVPDADIIAAALAICDAFDSGATFAAVALTALGSGFTTQTGGVLIGSSVVAYCDQHLGLIE